MNPALAVEAAAQRITRMLWLIALLIGTLWLVSGISTVEPGDRAVIMRWGAVQRVVESGLVVAWPRPIESIIRIPGAQRTLTVRINRFASPTSGSTLLAGTSAGDEAPAPTDPSDPGAHSANATVGCLTGDVGLVHLIGAVVWQVDDCQRYVTATADGQDLLIQNLERAFAASAITSCARRSVDGVLVAGSAQIDEAAAQKRERLRGELLIDLNARLGQLGLGISAQRIDLVVELPDGAKPAFAEVLSAAQAAERAVAEARADAERARQDAIQFRVGRLAQADASAREQSSQARVATDTIIALAQEHDPQRQRLMRERLYRERSETILRNAGQVVIMERSAPMALWLMQLWSTGSKP